MPAWLAQIAAPSSSVLHGSPALLPLMSQLVPFGVELQPPGPLQGDSMKCPAWQTSSRLASTQRASPLSHALPTDGLQLASQGAQIAARSSRVGWKRKARSSLALELAHECAIGAHFGVNASSPRSGNHPILLGLSGQLQKPLSRGAWRLPVGRAESGRHTLALTRRMKANGTPHR